MANASDFYDTFVLPAVEAWRLDTSSLRMAMDVASHLNAMIDHFWHEHRLKAPEKLSGKVESAGVFRHHICDQHEPLALIRDVADAHKHCELDRGSRRLTTAGQTSLRSMGWGEAEYGVAEFGESHAMVLTLDDGTALNFARVVWDACEIWNELLRRK